MLKKLLFAGVACMSMSAAFTSALAANSSCPAISLSALQAALKQAVIDTHGAVGLGLNMWATVVAPDGVVCLVANSSTDAIQGQWLASRVISAQKSFTAATLSLGPTSNSGSGTSLANGKLALSTANLYSAVNPGGSLFGLQHSNPVAAAEAYGDEGGHDEHHSGTTRTSGYGTMADPMIGKVIGGINVFGGGLALYASGGLKTGGVGVSGDTSCTDHLVAWRLRKNLGLDHLGTIGGVANDPAHPDNIVFDIVANPDGGTGKSASGWGHPVCLGATNAAATAAAQALPAVSP